MRNTATTAYTTVPTGVTVCVGHVRRNQRSRCRSPSGHLRRTIGHVPGIAGHVGPEYSQLEGELNYVKFVENRDGSGNLYPKLRVSVQNLGDELMLSLDLKGDVAQRLLVKLDNCQPGDYIRVSAWPTLVERGSRTYINHACSVKGWDGKEIPANTQISADIKRQTEEVEATLKSVNVTDDKLIAAAKSAKRIQAHKELLLIMQTRFEKAQIDA